MRLCVRSIVCAAAVFAAAGCQMARDLLPRTHTTAASPDRRYVASVYRLVEVSTDRGGAVLRNVAFGDDPIQVPVGAVWR